MQIEVNSVIVTIYALRGEILEGWQSGRMRRTRNPVYGYTVSWVQIPLLPPQIHAGRELLACVIFFLGRPVRHPPIPERGPASRISAGTHSPTHLPPSVPVFACKTKALRVFPFPTQSGTNRRFLSKRETKFLFSSENPGWLRKSKKFRAARF